MGREWYEARLGMVLACDGRFVGTGGPSGAVMGSLAVNAVELALALVKARESARPAG